MSNSISRAGVICAAFLGSVTWASLTQAEPQSFTVALTGADEAPPVDTGGSGTATFTYDPTSRVLTWNVSYNGLSGPATMAHVHDAAKGKNGPVVIWLSTKGTTAASPLKGEATLTPEQAQQFTAGQWYINLHTQAHPAGEIRGQVLPPKN